MPEIEIKLNDMSVLLTILEIDEVLPSIHFAAYLSAKQFDHSFSYDGSFWVENAVYDNFCNNLLSRSDGVFQFIGMDENFTLSIECLPKLSISCSIKRQGNAGELIESSYRRSIHLDEYAVIKKAFLDFPRWW